jgi:hypothetical protein
LILQKENEIEFCCFSSRLFVCRFGFESTLSLIL